MGTILDHREVSDLLGAYALDSCTPAESEAVAAHLAVCDACAAEAHRLRDAAGLLAASSGREPPADLRARTLEAARARRIPNLPPALAYAEQSEGLARLLTTLKPDQWSTTAVGDWTIHDLVAHLAATETLLAATLGLLDPDPLGGEKDLDRRTMLARERGRAPHETLAEWRRAVELVHRHVADPANNLERRIKWVVSMPLSRVLVSRAFETWIHADDIRRALGYPPHPPPPGRMRLVADLAVRSLPAALRFLGLRTGGQSALVVLAGDGGGEWTLALGEGSPAAPDAVLRADVIDFCLLAGGRLAPEELVYQAEGNAVLAADLVRAAPAFASA